MDLADLTRDLEALQAEATAAVAAAPDVATLDALELDVLGKKGRLTGVLRGIGALPAEDRPRVGAVANAVRIAIDGALAARREDLRGSELEARLAAETLDVTTPGRPIRRGTLHPINETIAEIAAIFGQFVHGLKKADIQIDRKILADLAVRDSATFGRIVELAKSA